jgi:hypothetical protein
MKPEPLEAKSEPTKTRVSDAHPPPHLRHAPRGADATLSRPSRPGLFERARGLAGAQRSMRVPNSMTRSGGKPK